MQIAIIVKDTLTELLRNVAEYQKDGWMPKGGELKPQIGAHGFYETLIK